MPDTASTRDARIDGSISWLDIREKGTVAGIRFMVLVGTALGRRAGRLVLHLITSYYVLFDRRACRASRAALSRMTGRPATLAMVYRHILRFAQVTLDRLFLIRGRDDLFEAEYTGHEHIVRLFEERRGAVLLTAHLGSWEAMGLDDRANRFRITAAGYFANAAMVNGILRSLNPRSNVQLIDIDSSQTRAVLQIRERLRSGGLVAMAADRIGVNQRCVEVEFFGARARFPTAPFLLAAILRCPVYLSFALYHEPNRYRLYCEPFCERIDAPRGERDAAIARHVQRFAVRLEHYCRLAPDNWFNFYDFWTDQAHAGGSVDAAGGGSDR